MILFQDHIAKKRKEKHIKSLGEMGLKAVFSAQTSNAFAYLFVSIIRLFVQNLNVTRWKQRFKS